MEKVTFTHTDKGGLRSTWIRFTEDDPELEQLLFEETKVYVDRLINVLDECADQIVKRREARAFLESMRADRDRLGDTLLEWDSWGSYMKIALKLVDIKFKIMDLKEYLRTMNCYPCPMMDETITLLYEIDH